MALVYCTLVDLQNRMSADGVTYRLDDSPAAADGDVLAEASALIDEYCLLRYGANLATSRIVKFWCVALACALLCERRLNSVPESAARRYEETIKKLERVQTGKLRIADAAETRISAPTGSNLRSRLDPTPHTVVEPTRSPSRLRPQDYGENRDQLDGLNSVDRQF